MKGKKNKYFLLGALLSLALCACGQEVEEVETNHSVSDETVSVDKADYSPISIVYTNDVHSYIANTVTINNDDDTTTEIPGLRFSKISQMVKDMEAQGREVILVDAGDEIQGNSYGSIDEGVSIIDIMNATGYDVATIGNHEFDYGMNQLFNIADKANYPYISCNFHSIDEDSTEDPFSHYEIFEVGGQTIAFIGIITPEAIRSSTPIYFQDGNGNYIYDIDGAGNPDELYASVQATIDEVSDEADYIIALGHVGAGEDQKKNHISSIDIINNTSGLDAFIDGHSHTVIEGELIDDKDGNQVILTQTGSYLGAVGVMEIDVDGNITTKLVTEYEAEDEEVVALENQLIERINDEYGKQIAVLETELYICNPEDANQRLIRARELNAGDFIADAFYWYSNENMLLDCDVVLQNGGGIRAALDAGDVTINDVKNVQPFGNVACLISASGQQIIDCLEMGATEVGLWDEQWNAPAEKGGFMHVAGLRFTIDSTIPDSVVVDDNELFASVDGEYRVKDVEIYNRETGEYEPIDPNKQYRVAGINYILRNGGSGMTMFMDCDNIVDYVNQDVDIVIDYIKSFTVSGEYPLINTENSPLSDYEGYLIDYENPYGSGRINIILE